MIETLGFGIAAACALASAIFVVRGPNLVHAALWLGVTLLATAALYALLGASFLASIQVLLYVGGIITLMLFGVMITRRHEGIVVLAEGRNQARAAVVAAALFGVVAAAIRATDGLDGPLQPPAMSPETTADLGRSLLGEYVLAFEVVSLLLLVAIVGAIVIARRRDPAPDGAREPAPASVEAGP
jgi:NADH:ubiquinone oxidoreductase subunit 6 (subunit J)